MITGAAHDSTSIELTVGTMCAALRARGPDDAGMHVTGERVGIGNRRLAIQDLSPAGHMPMANERGDIWITYNGEIYNTAELRAALEGLGFISKSHGDTELILLGYEAWGEGVVDHLRGMYAFAIHDARGSIGRVFLARDPLGIKPLYYTAIGPDFAFASECRALVEIGAATREISPDGLLAYLQLGSVPAPLTIYRDIRSLQAGHTMRVDVTPRGWRASEPRAFWRMPPPPDPSGVPSYAGAVAQLRDILTDSVRRHLVSDVPLGAFLSGGLDSGSVVALMRSANPTGTIRTCSVVFEEPEYNEANLARLVAQRFQTEHVEIPVTAADLAVELEHVITSLDQPSNDGINTYFVSKAAREHGLTVALSGLGGDELFGGYPSFMRLPTLLRASHLSGLVPGARGLIQRALLARGPHHPTARIGGWWAAADADAVALYLGLRGLFSKRALDQLIRAEVVSEVRSRGTGLLDLVRADVADMRGCSPFEVTSRLELSCYMRHQLLRDSDVMSMAHSLEVRVPFVDHSVVERVYALQPALARGKLPKQALRDAVPEVPNAVRLRRDKQGFSFPFGPWFRGPLREPLRDLVATADAHLSAYLQPGAALGVLSEFEAGRVHWSRVWALASLCTTLTGSEGRDSQLRVRAGT